MTEIAGWSGRILAVDLERNHVEHQATADYGPLYLGGRALGAAIAWQMLRPGLDPLSPDNPLMFLNGPLAGTNAPAAGRTTVCSLAPQSWPKPWFSRASMGGDLGHAIKAAGLDGIVITGRAPRPVYLAVQDDDASLVDAEDLWGRGIMDRLHRPGRRDPLSHCVHRDQ